MTLKSQNPIWETFPSVEFTILAVARTSTSAYRLLEAAQWFRDDFRIRFVFTVDPGSAFSVEVPALLRAAGVTLIDWKHIKTSAFHYDLVLSASENVDFASLRAHTILLAHGIGFNKLLASASEPSLRLAGLPPEQVMRSSRVTIMLSHPEQREQLRAVTAAATDVTEVVGDPVLDRLHASRALRPRYRDALGTRDRALVAVASTWGRHSVIGRWPTLPVRLLATLPADSYQVVAILHPNIWAYYGAQQIEAWLSSALRAGLVLMPPESGWQAALIACDQLITDHGSLGLFGADLDKPILMTGPAPETVPGTPIDELAHATTTLDLTADLRRQLDDARNEHTPGRYDRITSRVFAHRGHAAERIRSLVYRELKLEPPTENAGVQRIPVPTPRDRPITSYVGRNAVVRDGELRLERFPASVLPDTDQALHETHLIADETEPDAKTIERAAIITRDELLAADEAVDWASASLAAYPGARMAVAALPDGWLAMTRGSVMITVDTHSPEPAHVQLVASALYCLLLDSGLRNRRLTIHAGARIVPITITVDQAAGSVVR